MNKRSIGAQYERYAADYLELKGYHIISRNYHSPYGEIDLIAQDKDYLCFVEVKYRSDLKGGYPQEAVNHTKQQRIKRTAAWYLQKEQRHFSKCRFDVVGISGTKIWLHKNAFGGI